MADSAFDGFMFVGFWGWFFYDWMSLFQTFLVICALWTAYCLLDEIKNYRVRNAPTL